MGGASTRSILIGACALALGGLVRLTVNGQKTELPVDTPTDATDAQISALDGAGIKWTDPAVTVAEPAAPAPIPVAVPAPMWASPTDVAVVTAPAGDNPPADTVPPAALPQTEGQAGSAPPAPPADPASTTAAPAPAEKRTRAPAAPKPNKAPAE